MTPDGQVNPPKDIHDYAKIIILKTIKIHLFRTTCFIIWWCFHSLLF